MGPRMPSSRTLNGCASLGGVVSLSEVEIGPEPPLTSFLPSPEGAHDGRSGAGQPVNDASASSSAPEAALATLADAAERAYDYAGRSKSQATINAYAAGWRDFLTFC